MIVKRIEDLVKEVGGFMRFDDIMSYCILEGIVDPNLKGYEITAQVYRAIEKSDKLKDYSYWEKCELKKIVCRIKK